MDPFQDLGFESAIAAKSPRGERHHEFRCSISIHRSIELLFVNRCNWTKNSDCKTSEV